MGFAVPAAIGAKLARPDAEVWAIVGDGGFQMTQAELATLVQEGEDQHRDHQQRLPRHGAAVAAVSLTIAAATATPMRSPDFVKIAEARPSGVRVTGREGTMAAIRHARASAGPVLIEFRVAPEDADYPMVSPGPPGTRYRRRLARR